MSDELPPIEWCPGCEVDIITTNWIMQNCWRHPPTASSPVSICETDLGLDPGGLIGEHDEAWAKHNRKKCDFIHRDEGKI
jgi:hypothetical protein